MIRFRLLLLVLVFAGGCSQRSDNDPAEPARELLAGQGAYERVCATCHEEGLDGAPATGDREAWANRSSLWAAVLEEHANSGYLSMPAKGGDPSLSDEEISAATEHMLALTYPDRPTE